jgi:hypothetical protein
MLLLLLALFAFCSAEQRVYPEYQDGRLMPVPSGWKIKFVEKKPFVPLTIALKQKNVKALEV